MSVLRVLTPLAFAFGILASGAASAAPVASDADLAKQIPCAQCHMEVVKNFTQSRHGVTADKRTPGNNCSSCHGETLRHMSNPMKEKPEVTFKKDAKGFMSLEMQAKADKTCTSCHKGTDQTHWFGSTHQNNQVGCTSCHAVHGHDVALNDKTSTALCLSCHADQKANLFKHSGHPILSGQMNCVSCHNPHGDKPAGEGLLKKGTVNETCYGCHPDKRGPFLFNHEPVTEDCTSCHTPHGSNKSSMLKAREPQLCLSCHANAHHALGKEKMGGCTRCHSAVHGSHSINGKGLAK